MRSFVSVFAGSRSVALARVGHVLRFLRRLALGQARLLDRPVFARAPARALAFQENSAPVQMVGSGIARGWLDQLDVFASLLLCHL